MSNIRLKAAIQIINMNLERERNAILDAPDGMNDKGVERLTNLSVCYACLDYINNNLKNIL